MRFLILAAAVGAVAIPATANAQYYGGRGYGNQREVRQEIRECRRELRRADSRREYQRELRECRREIAAARHGYRDGRGYRYRGYRDDYYRDRRW
jgi:hypothetical protein